MNSLQTLFIRLAFIRETFKTQLIQKNAQGPYVSLEILHSFLKTLRRHIYAGSASLRAILYITGVRSPAEIADLDVLVFVEKDVFQFQVTKYYSLRVQVLDRQAALEKEQLDVLL